VIRFAQRPRVMRRERNGADERRGHEQDINSISAFRWVLGRVARRREPDFA
jgi:hypothetical protein